MTLHLIKLAVGARTLTDVRAWQARRAMENPPLRHQTRNTPRRAAEILQGGSIYWVIAGQLAARQRITAIQPGTREDETVCTDLILDPRLVAVRGRPVKAFQGWRYLTVEDAPGDLVAGTGEDLPEALRRDLAAAGLL